MALHLTIESGNMRLGAELFNLITNQNGDVTHVHVFYLGWKYQDIIPVERVKGLPLDVIKNELPPDYFYFSDVKFADPKPTWAISYLNNHWFRFEKGINPKDPWLKVRTGLTIPGTSIEKVVTKS